MRCSCRACSPLLRQFSLEPLHTFFVAGAEPANSRRPQQPPSQQPFPPPGSFRLEGGPRSPQDHLRGGVSGTGAALCWPGKGTTDILAELIALIFFPLLSFFLLPKGVHYYYYDYHLCVNCLPLPWPRRDGKERKEVKSKRSR